MGAQLTEVSIMWTARDGAVRRVDGKDGKCGQRPGKSATSEDFPFAAPTDSDYRRVTDGADGVKDGRSGKRAATSRREA